MKRLNQFMAWLTVIATVTAGCATPTAAPESPTAAPAATSGGAVQTIKVGALYPLTGPDAGWAGDPYIKAHQLAIDEINAPGGIKCLDGAQLELVKGDTQGKAEVGNSEMERLITQEGVVAVMGSALSGTTLPASEISERYGVPYIVPNALDGTISDRGLKTVFQTVSTLQQWGADDALWAKENGAKTAVITVPNFTFGTEVADTWTKGAEENGLELLGSVVYDGAAQDFTDTILKVRDLNPDVWFLLGNNQAPLLIKQAKEQGYWPTMGIITLGSGFATSFFLAEAGAELADGIIVTSDFAPVSSLNVDEAFKAKFAEYTGQDL
ncbi:MAG TPA: ABC transporter substrate-binding protein, partial [Anaerolineales bacterium]|nr:ABC transporter substrate-binding protein [Anaerolineales bacterium]